jgi:hypothetical protein
MWKKQVVATRVLKLIGRQEFAQMDLHATPSN